MDLPVDLESLARALANIQELDARHAVLCQEQAFQFYEKESDLLAAEQEIKPELEEARAASHALELQVRELGARAVSANQTHEEMQARLASSRTRLLWVQENRDGLDRLQRAKDRRVDWRRDGADREARLASLVQEIKVQEDAARQDDERAEQIDIDLASLQPPNSMPARSPQELLAQDEVHKVAHRARLARAEQEQLVHRDQFRVASERLRLQERADRLSQRETLLREAKDELIKATVDKARKDIKRIRKELRRQKRVLQKFRQLDPSGESLKLKQALARKLKSKERIRVVSAELATLSPVDGLREKVEEAKRSYEAKRNLGTSIVQSLRLAQRVEQTLLADGFDSTLGADLPPAAKREVASGSLIAQTLGFPESTGDWRCSPRNKPAPARDSVLVWPELESLVHDHPFHVVEGERVEWLQELASGVLGGVDSSDARQQTGRLREVLRAMERWAVDGGSERQALATLILAGTRWPIETSRLLGGDGHFDPSELALQEYIDGLLPLLEAGRDAAGSADWLREGALIETRRALAVEGLAHARQAVRESTSHANTGAAWKEHTLQRVLAVQRQLRKASDEDFALVSLRDSLPADAPLVDDCTVTCDFASRTLLLRNTTQTLEAQLQHVEDLAQLPSITSRESIEAELTGRRVAALIGKRKQEFLQLDAPMQSLWETWSWRIWEIASLNAEQVDAAHVHRVEAALREESGDWVRAPPGEERRVIPQARQILELWTDSSRTLVQTSNVERWIGQMRLITLPDEWLTHARRVRAERAKAEAMLMGEPVMAWDSPDSMLALLWLVTHHQVLGLAPIQDGQQSSAMKEACLVVTGEAHESSPANPNQRWLMLSAQLQHRAEELQFELARGERSLEQSREHDQVLQVFILMRMLGAGSTGKDPYAQFMGIVHDFGVEVGQSVFSTLSREWQDASLYVD